MDLIEGLLSRRSIRRFKSKPIDDEIINNILELANTAPSAGNLQAREFLVVREDKVKKRLAAAALNQDFVHDAPVVIVVCANQAHSAAGYGSRGRDFYSIQDADAAVMHIVLAAHAMGLGTCWVGAYDDDAVAAVLGLPEHVRPIAILPIGYPAETPSKTSRIPIEKLVHLDGW